MELVSHVTSVNTVLPTTARHFPLAGLNTSSTTLGHSDDANSTLSGSRSPDSSPLNPPTTTMVTTTTAAAVATTPPAPVPGVSPQSSPTLQPLLLLPPPPPSLLNLPSLPNTPGNESNRRPSGRRPSSAELIRTDHKSFTSQFNHSNITSPKSDQNSDTSVQSNEYKISDNTNKSCADSPTTATNKSQTMNDWMQMFQQFASFCCGKLQTDENVMRNSHETTSPPTNTESVDPMLQFQSMLTNMGQMLFGSQLKQFADTISSDMTDPVTWSESWRTAPCTQRNAMHETANPIRNQSTLGFPNPPHSSPTGGSQTPCSSSNVDIARDPLIAAASLLALLIDPKHNNHSDSQVHSNPFTPLMNSFVSQSAPSSSSSPDISALLSSGMFPATFSQTDPNNFNKPLGFNLPDNRDLLYQLGQRLMAMAAAPSTVECYPKSPLWNPNVSADSSTISPNSAAVTQTFNPSTPPNLLPNPMLAIMNATLFPPLSTAYNATLPCGPVHSGTEKKSHMFNQNSLLGPTFDKALHHLPTSGASLSGISMRGNQKYSAYYQHQRKQGFPLGATSEYATTGGMRRQNSTITSPLSHTRFGNRRFKSGSGNGTVNSLGSEFRGDSRLRGTTGKSGSGIFSCFRGASYKHTLPSPTPAISPNRQKHQLASESLLHVSSGEAVQPTNRLRDTAFLCSCGKDFESLYIFTLHMKDTGHKPKSDQSERDIPKLVRGQDMWINSETEQTREILRCMRCHQSFRNLPELTLHMMKTNHYSEIVYNDSGRLVFVNPDEHRRGTSINSSVASTNTSPSKATASTLTSTTTKRGVKTSPHIPCISNVYSSWCNGLQSHGCADTSATTVRKEVSVCRADSLDRSALPSDPSVSMLPEGTKSQDVPNQDKPTCANVSMTTCAMTTHTDTPMDTKNCLESTLATKQKAPSDPLDVLASSISPASGQDVEIPACADSSTDTPTQPFESNVIRQIESFVENSLPRQSRSLSVRVDSCSSVTSQISSPLSLQGDTTVGLSTNVSGLINCKVSPKMSRKRTHSGASISQSHSTASSPLSEASDKTKDGTSTRPNKRVTLSPSSPAKVTSTCDHNPHLVENPLSSLQKLVDTTSKHRPTTSSLGTANSSALFITSCSTSAPPNTRPSGHIQSASKTTSPVTRGQFSPRCKTPNIAVGSTSSTTSSSTFTHLLSPTIDNTLSPVPALSALYAYVERSSTGQTTEVHRNSTNDKSSVVVQNQQDRITISDNQTSPLPNAMNPALQAIYAAAMTTLATQHLQSQIVETQGANSIEDPSQLFREVALSFNEASDTSDRSILSTNAGLATSWLRMLHAFGTQLSKFDKDGTRPSSTEESVEQNVFKECLQAALQTQSQCSQDNNGMSSSHNGSMNDRIHTLNSGAIGGRTDNRSPMSPRFVGVHSSVMSDVVAMNGGIVQSVAPSLTPDSLSDTRPSAATLQSNRYHPTMPGRIPGSGSNQTTLMSTMISKKAKCHFCGKPFANKGQVRLHISKNKCPCLLQRSCHVAALAAAFGSESRQVPHSLASTLTNKPNIVTSVNHVPNLRTTSVNIQPSEYSPSDRSNLQVGASEYPSALRLLKERFQNFDLVQPAPSRLTESHGMDTGLNKTAFSGAFTPQTNTSVNNTAPAATCSFSSIGQNNLPPNDVSHSGSTGPVNAAAAANASHLAAMAFLAQTLVQLTSSQATGPQVSPSTAEPIPPYPTTSLPHRQPLPASLPTDPNNPLSLFNPANINWELLMTHANIAKHLANLTWSGTSLDSSHGDPSTTSVLSTGQLTAAPNGLP